MANQTNKLTADLEVNGLETSVAKVDKFKGALTDADKAIAKLSAGTNFAGDLDKQIAAVERRTLDLAFQLNKIGQVTLGVAGVDGLGKAAGRAETQLRSTYARLQQLDALGAVTKDPVILKGIQAEAAKTTADLDKLQNKINRVAAGREAAAARRPAGSNINARGLVGSASAAGVPFAFEAAAGLDAAAAAGIGTGALVAFGAIAVAGVAIVKISENIRAEAERRLKVEESIAVAANKQIIAGQTVLKDLKAARAEAEFNRQLQEDLDKGTVESLTRRRALTEQLLNLNPTGPNSENNQKTILEIDAKLAALEKAKTTTADAAFNQRNENFKQAQKTAADLEAKQKESANAGADRVRELGKTTDDFFQSLFAKQGSANPFVTIFNEGQEAIEKTRLATAALSDELKAQAEQMVRTSTANSLFTARLETQLQASDLRAEAKTFRTGGGTANADALANSQIERFRADIANGTFRNPENLRIFGQGTSAKVAGSLFDFQQQLEQSGGLFRNPAFDAERRQALIDQNPDNVSVRDRLNRQLDVIRGLRPENEFQRSEADRKIIALTQGINPADLTEADRNAAATARENEATRVSNAEAAAQTERVANAKVQASIDKNIADLLKIAKSDGLTGVIRIINEAEDRAAASLGKRPGPRDVQSQMQ